jgi:hypothetical protein
MPVGYDASSCRLNSDMTLKFNRQATSSTFHFDDSTCTATQERLENIHKRQHDGVISIIGFQWLQEMKLEFIIGDQLIRVGLLTKFSFQPLKRRIKPHLPSADIRSSPYFPR